MCLFSPCPTLVLLVPVLLRRLLLYIVLLPGPVTDPKVLIEGVLFRARYLGSTQLVCEGQPTKATRMMQAEEAVSRIKVTFSIENTEGIVQELCIWYEWKTEKDNIWGLV